MKVLITGINGFVGKFLALRLENEGYDVFGIDILKGHKNCTIADLTDPIKISTVINEIQPDFIIHLAAFSNVRISDTKDLYSINIIGTQNVLRAASSLSKKPKFIYISSAQVYGNVAPAKQPIPESTAIDPINHYGASKASGEMICKAFTREQGLPVVIVRPFNHTGNGQKESFVVPKIINKFITGAGDIELGNIDVVREFMDVRDVVDAYSLLIKNFPNNEVYNISTGTGHSVKEVVSRLIAITGKQMNVTIQKDQIRKNDIPMLVGNNTKIKDHFSWVPRYRLEDTLKWILSLK